jgi:hypothetical protein
MQRNEIAFSDNQASSNQVRHHRFSLGAAETQESADTSNGEPLADLERAKQKFIDNWNPSVPRDIRRHKKATAWHIKSVCPYHHRIIGGGGAHQISPAATISADLELSIAVSIRCIGAVGGTFFHILVAPTITTRSLARDSATLQRFGMRT